MERAAIVVQARMGSRRLPGKVLAELGSRTLLEHCVYRLRGNRLPIIVATTDLPEDDAIERAARRLNLDVFRGAEDDVLSRILGAARAFDLTHIVRATADNPLVDCEGPRRVLELVRRVQADHAIECGMPVGTAVEAVTVEALHRSQALIADPYDRRHVTSFVRRDNRFRALRAVAPGDIRRPGLRLTVDTPEDLDFLRAVFVSLGVVHEAPRLSAIIRAAESLLVRAVAGHRTQQGA
jgi:spore coat polysaccharide biosynthesis protein SpsF (cytidylyltransferase family)